MMTVNAAGRPLYSGMVSGLSMLRLGKIFAAEGASSLKGWEDIAKDLTPKEIVKRFLNNPEYQAEPIPLDDEPAAQPKAKAAQAAEAANAHPYKVYMCMVCGYKYDEAKGDQTQGVPAGTRWEDVPDTWVCPECGESKSAFEEDMVDVTHAAPAAKLTAQPIAGAQ